MEDEEELFQREVDQVAKDLNYFTESLENTLERCEHPGVLESMSTVVRRKLHRAKQEYKDAMGVLNYYDSTEMGGVKVGPLKDAADYYEEMLSEVSDRGLETDTDDLNFP